MIRKYSTIRKHGFLINIRDIKCCTSWVVGPQGVVTVWPSPPCRGLPTVSCPIKIIRSVLDPPTKRARFKITTSHLVRFWIYIKSNHHRVNEHLLNKLHTVQLSISQVNKSTFKITCLSTLEPPRSMSCRHTLEWPPLALRFQADTWSLRQNHSGNSSLHHLLCCQSRHNQALQKVSS